MGTAGGERTQLQFSTTLGGGEPGVDSRPGGPQPGRVLGAHTAIEILFISCHKNVSPRKEGIFLFYSFTAPLRLVCNNFFCMHQINEYLNIRFDFHV